MKKTLTFKFERLLPAPLGKVYDAWLNPKFRGNPWNEADKLILNPKVDGFFYWHIGGVSHYGRFTKMKRPSQIQHTWVSPYTLGEESTVTVTFKKKGDGTLMTLLHSDLPNNEKSKSHDEGWNYFLGKFSDRFKTTSRKKK